jgi:hypothetical protein
MECYRTTTTTKTTTRSHGIDTEEKKETKDKVHSATKYFEFT